MCRFERTLSSSYDQVIKVMTPYPCKFTRLCETPYPFYWSLGYVMRMEYNGKTGDMTVHTLSVLAKLKHHHFNISEAGPPSKATAFSSFQAKGKSYFMHTEVFQDRELLSKILGAYSVFEERKTWTKGDSTMQKSN